MTNYAQIILFLPNLSEFEYKSARISSNISNKNKNWKNNAKQE